MSIAYYGLTTKPWLLQLELLCKLHLQYVYVRLLIAIVMCIHVKIHVQFILFVLVFLYLFAKFLAFMINEYFV